jgi:hypothetical protein
VEIRDVTDRALSAVLRVWAGEPSDPKNFQGTAFLIAPDRLLTAAHVAEGIALDRLFVTGRPWAGVRRVRDLKAHSEGDVALMTLAPEAAATDGSLPIPIARPGGLKPGIPVLAAGFSTADSDLEQIATTLRSYDDRHRIWQLDNYVPHGASGGPVLFSGKVIGVISARHVDRNATYVTPLSVVEELIGSTGEAAGGPPGKRRRSKASSAAEERNGSMLQPGPAAAARKPTALRDAGEPRTVKGEAKAASSRPVGAGMQKFFISYNNKDRSWAEWIAWSLKAAGHGVTIDVWDFRPGHNFVVKMHEALQSSDRLLAVLSPDFLNADFPEAEWAATFADDPTGNRRKLIPVKVRPCSPTGLLKPIIFIDLVGLDETAAEQRLLEGLRDSGVPETRPNFPAAERGRPAASSATSRPEFPGGRADSCRRPIQEVTRAVTVLLAKSATATDRIRAALKLLNSATGLGDRAADAARILVARPIGEVVLALRNAHESIQASEPSAAKVIRHVTREIILLIYDEADVALLRAENRDHGGSFIKFPAASETAAEIAMAAADRRTPGFVKAGASRKWPRGCNSIPIPPETGPEGFGGFIEAFEAFLLDLVLDSRERGKLSPECQLKEACARLLLDRHKSGTLYFTFDFPEHEGDKLAFTNAIKYLHDRWEPIVFLTLSTDSDRLAWERNILWAIRHMLPEDDEAR